MFFATSTLALLALFGKLSSGFPINRDTYEYPATNSIYHQETGRVEYDIGSPERPAVLKRIGGLNKDQSVLVVFSFSEGGRGKTCQFMFELDGPEEYNGAGTVFDVFRSSKPINDHVASGSSNHRDQYMGRMRSVAGGQAVPFYAEESMERFQFPCPPPISKDNPVQTSFEIVPTGGHSSFMSWTKLDGPWIAYL